MFVPQSRWLIKSNKTDWKWKGWCTGNCFWLLSKVENCYKVSNRGGCDGEWWTGRTPFFHFFLWIGGRSNFAFFPRLIFVSCLLSLVSCLRWSCSLVSSCGWSKKPTKQGNEIKTKNLSHKNVTDKRTFPATRLRQTSTSLCPS